jgi:phenylpyruvate tautomerase PptA (4-oxalocrotonate tautomerase family)
VVRLGGRLSFATNAHRVTIAAFNRWAQQLCLALGFREVGRFTRTDLKATGQSSSSSEGEGAVTVPMVSVLNLRREDPLPELQEAITLALTSMPELRIEDWEVNLVPVRKPDDFVGEVARINVDLWEREERTKEALQELATRVAKAFQAVAGEDRKVKVVIRPYNVETSGWVSL